MAFQNAPSAATEVCGITQVVPSETLPNLINNLPLPNAPFLPEIAQQAMPSIVPQILSPELYVLSLQQGVRVAPIFVPSDLLIPKDTALNGVGLFYKSFFSEMLMEEFLQY